MLHSALELTGLLAKVKSIAIVGAVDKPGRPVDRIGRYLIEAGFTVIPVHPKRMNIWGLETYASLTDIPVPVDLVNLFRRAEFCPEHARETLQMNPLPMGFWMQSGIICPEAREILQAAPITIVEDRCVMVEHQGA